MVRKSPAHAVLLRVEQSTGRRVDADDLALLVQQHQPLLHAAGDLAELVPLPPQLAQLGVDLAALLVDASQQGRQLLVGIVLQRVLQIQLVEGLYDMLGQPPGQQGRQRQRQHQYDQEGLEHAQHQHARGGAADGDTQHGAVIQALRLIDGLFQQRGGVAAGLALPRQQRLLDLLALAVVLHTGGVGAGIVQHGAVGRHPGEAVAVRAEGSEVALPLPLLHGGGRQAQLILELLLLHAAEVFVKAAHNDHQAGQQHRARRDHHGAENSFRHVRASHL